MYRRRWQLVAAMVVMGVGSCFLRQGSAVETTWSGATSNVFTEATNWTNGVPSSFNDVAVLDGGANYPVVIGANAGTREIGAFQLGLANTFGSVIQNGGTLVIDGKPLGIESVVGDAGAQASSWIMNNDATILYGDPLGGNGNGLDTDGNGQDFDIGKNATAEATGVFEMHGSSVLRIGDDLKIADGSDGHARFVMDGNSKATIGSGISASGTTEIVLAGQALLVTGNSADPGDRQAGRTNEGYLTMSGAQSTVTIQDDARFYVRTLQKRSGESTITLRNNGQFHVFDPFTYAAPNLGQATVVGAATGPQRTSNISEGANDVANIILHDHSSMSFDTDLEDSTYAGLALSGGTNRGGNAAGGYVLIEVHDQASFAVAQDLHMAFGTGETAESILKVVGPDAQVRIDGDLRMAINELDEPNPGTATLYSVITGNKQGTVKVGDTAFIGNGKLQVELSGYSPQGGDIYELITAKAINGAAFADTSLPALPNGLTWNLSIAPTSVQLRVSLPGDYNNDGVLDAADIDQLSAAVRTGGPVATFDLNKDGSVNDGDRLSWVNDRRRTYLGDANLDGEFSSADFVDVFAAGEYEDATAGNSGWAEGDWDGNGDFDSGDFVAAFVAGGYELGPRTAVAAVPEPSTLALMGLACGWIARFRRRK